MRFITHGNVSEIARAELEAEVSPQENLKAMMTWALSKPKGTFLPAIVSDVVVQDEFTHEVVVPRSDGLVLVYDTT